MIFSNLKFDNYVYASNTYYARIENTYTFFYSTPTESDSSKMFILPNTYFVELLKNENAKFYYAKYFDLYGYVLKSSVRPVVGTPLNPYAEKISFRVFVPSGANLRSSPYDQGSVNLIYSIPFLDSNIVYYGILEGEESISKKGKTWYYCKYLSNNKEYIGYVYSPLCDCLTPINTNTEVFDYMKDEPFFEETPKFENIQAGVNVFQGLSNTATTIIIIAVSLPCLLFIYLLFKPTRMAEQTPTTESKTKNTNNKPKKKKISRLKHSDYYEIDDNF